MRSNRAVCAAASFSIDLEFEAQPCRATSAPIHTNSARQARVDRSLRKKHLCSTSKIQVERQQRIPWTLISRAVTELGVRVRNGHELLLHLHDALLVEQIVDRQLHSEVGKRELLAISDIRTEVEDPRRASLRAARAQLVLAG